MRLCRYLLPALALGAGIVGSAHAADEEAQIDQGREIYGEFCVACHGRDLVSTSPVTFDLRKFPNATAKARRCRPGATSSPTKMSRCCGPMSAAAGD